jgi:hypothetical protein
VGSQPGSHVTTAEDALVTQTHNCSDVPGVATCNYRGTDRIDNTISLGLHKVPDSQAGKLLDRELPPTPSTRSSLVYIGQPTQVISGDILPEAITHQA